MNDLFKKKKYKKTALDLFPEDESANQKEASK
jgi:hypothetical protein